MGGKTKTTQSVTVDPKVMAMATGNYDRARQIADTPVTPYSGMLDLSGSQRAAQGLLGFHAPQVQAGQLRDTDLSSYLNPYISNVIDTSVADSERARQMEVQNTAARANAAGAFGGSRHGVAESLTNEAAIRSRDSMVANLRAQGFTAAQAAALADIQNRLAADTANQGAAVQSAGVRAQGAGLLADLEQARYGADYTEFLRQQNDPLLKQQLLTQALGGVPVPQTSTTTQKGGGLFGSGIRVGWDAQKGLSFGA